MRLTPMIRRTTTPISVAARGRTVPISSCAAGGVSRPDEAPRAVGQIGPAAFSMPRTHSASDTGAASPSPDKDERARGFRHLRALRSPTT